MTSIKMFEKLSLKIKHKQIYINKNLLLKFLLLSCFFQKYYFVGVSVY